MQSFIKKLQSAFKETTFEVTEHHSNWSTIRIPSSSLQSVAKYVKETVGFDHAISVSVIDEFDNNQFLISYHLSSVFKSQLHGKILTLEVAIPRSEAKTPSLIEIWPSVEWHEREGWEMFGVEFDGHPKLERLLLPESWEGGFPLRKDFRLREGSS
ncbi:MAG: NADH-quinone oxidoreductase subunit C [Promethearchaeota archaeon]